MDRENESNSGDTGEVDNRAVVSTTEAARQLGVSVRTVQLWVESKRLAAWKTAGNHRRIFQWSIDEYKKGEGQLQSPDSDRHRGEGPGSTILIIEDDRTTQVYYQTMLQLLEYPDKLEFADNGIEGMVAIGRLAPWLIVIDIDMPRLDGIEVLKTLERQSSDVAAIVISNVDHDAALQRGLPKDCIFLSKPVSLNDFRDALETKRVIALKRANEKQEKKSES